MTLAQKERSRFFPYLSLIINSTIKKKKRLLRSPPAKVGEKILRYFINLFHLANPEFPAYCPTAHLKAQFWNAGNWRVPLSFCIYLATICSHRLPRIPGRDEPQAGHGA
jgi:hypothetical protein